MGWTTVVCVLDINLDLAENILQEFLLAAIRRLRSIIDITDPDAIEHINKSIRQLGVRRRATKLDRKHSLRPNNQRER